MFETIRDAAKLGLGAVALSKENLKKLSDDLAAIGTMSRDEGDRLYNELNEARKKNIAAITEVVEEKVRGAVDKMGLAPKTEIDALEKRIADLEAALKEKEGC